MLLGILEDIKDIPGTVIDILVSKKTGRRERHSILLLQLKRKQKALRRASPNGFGYKIRRQYFPGTRNAKSAVFEGKLGRALEQL